MSLGSGQQRIRPMRYLNSFLSIRRLMANKNLVQSYRHTWLDEISSIVCSLVAIML